MSQAPEWAQDAGKLRLAWLGDPRIVRFKYGNDIYTSGNFDQSIVVQKRTEECEKCETHLKVSLWEKKV